MPSKVASTVLAAITVMMVNAQSPPGFSPPVNTPLSVDYAGFEVTPGVNVPAQDVTNAPTLDFYNSTEATFLSVLMDFDVQLPGVSGNQTLIHWIQPGFSSATEPLRSQAAAVAPYFPPGPPAGQTHTYGIFLYKQPESTFTVPADFQAFFQNLTASPNNRIGFDLDKFAQSANLGDPLAADFFFVSTPGNASTATATSSAASASVTGAPSGSTVRMPQATGGGGRVAASGAAIVGVALIGLTGLL